MNRPLLFSLLVSVFGLISLVSLLALKATLKEMVFTGALFAALLVLGLASIEAEDS
jgi:hypothetical protein